MKKKAVSNLKKVNKLAIVNKNVCGIDVGSGFHQTAISMEKQHLKPIWHLH